MSAANGITRRRIVRTCRTCANWRENPEQCYDCNRNPANVDRWRPIGSRGFTRDTGKPVNPKMPCCQNEKVEAPK